MTIAELHNKSGAEDTLSSDVFMTLKYLPPELGLVPWLKSIFERKGLSLPSILTQPISDGQVKIHFWPRRKRELDVLVIFTIKNAQIVFAIEAKLDSGTSDKKIDETAMDEAAEAEITGQQLPDEFFDLIDCDSYKGRHGENIPITAADSDRYLIFLTKHSSFPYRDLERAKEVISKKQNSLRAEYVENHLLWSRWSDVFSVMTRCEGQRFPYRLIANDLAELLRKKGLRTFDGFDLGTFALSGSGKFFIPILFQRLWDPGDLSSRKFFRTQHYFFPLHNLEGVASGRFWGV